MQSNSDEQNKSVLDEKIEILNNLIEIQKKCIAEDRRYMIGLYNGLILAKSVLTDEEPLFYEEEEGMKHG